MKDEQRGFAGIFILIAVVGLAIFIAGFLWTNLKQNLSTEVGKHSYFEGNQNQADKQESQPNQKEGKDYLSSPAVTNQLPSCQGDQLLSVSPVDLNEMPAIYPLGNLNPNGHIYPSDHMGIGLVRENLPGNNAPNLKTDIKAPGDVHIFGIRRTTYKTNGVVTNEDYTMAMAPCREVTIYFAHLNSLSEALLKSLENAQKDCPSSGQKEGDKEFIACEYHLDYAAKSGEIIATAGGANPALPDFGSFDIRSSLAFINPGLYTYGTLHASCPLDYYSEPLKSDLYAKLKRQVEPRCGEVMQDKLGTIQGDWHTKESSEGSWANQLGILHDNVDPGVGVVISGGTISDPGTIEYNPKHSGTVNREPSEVTADGKIYCYFSDRASRNSNNLLGGVILIQLQDDQTLKVEHSEGNCAQNKTFKNPFTYQR